ncbi:Zinc-transporting ATPase [compost metagenome]
MGDFVFAGAIAQNEFELSITHPQGERMIDSWAESALLSDSSKSEHTKLFSRIENALVIFAFCGALLIASIQTFKGAGTRTIIESFFIGILIFCPCLFASIIPLMKQMAHLALLKSGIMLTRSDALLDLSQVTNFYFDKTGTLEAMESTFIPLEESGKTVTPYLHALAIKSKHVILRGLSGPENSTVISEIREHPGKGVEAAATDGIKILVGRSSFLEEMGIESCGLDSIFSHVAMNGKVVGQVLSKPIYDSKSKYFLKKLLNSVPDVKIEILSGDPRPDAGKYFTNIDQKISFRGNLSPEEKAQAIRGYSAFIGDGLNDTLALAKARVSFRIGHRIIGFAPVDFHLQLPNIDLILATIHYSKKYRKVLIQTGCAAFLYNILALTLASLGKFSPLGAVLAMLTSFSLMLLSAFRLNRLQSRTQGMTP